MAPMLKRWKDTDCLVMNEGAGVNISADNCGQGIGQLIVKDARYKKTVNDKRKNDFVIFVQ